jgi:hypothetical protein
VIPAAACLAQAISVQGSGYDLFADHIAQTAGDSNLKKIGVVAESKMAVVSHGFSKMR